MNEIGGIAKPNRAVKKLQTIVIERLRKIILFSLCSSTLVLAVVHII